MFDDGRFSTQFVNDARHDAGHFLIEKAPASTGKIERVATSGYSPGSQANRQRRITAINPIAGSKGAHYDPAVVLSFPRWRLRSEALLQRFELFSKDPEFLPSFLNKIVVLMPKAHSHPQLEVSDSAWDLLDEWRCSQVFTLSVEHLHDIPEGPYFLGAGTLHRTWRLYPDDYEAFQLPTIGPHPTKFVGITIMHQGKLMVPVPSRLHYPKCEKKPLNGMRFSVKDNVDLEGVQTTAQSRAFEKTYGPASHTASTVSRLLELGAVVVGKTKCTQFASSDQPTADWVDYHCPWNPRGDGYISPRGSSTGPSVAVAGYSWVDFGFGTDTGGSIRGPAETMGLLALRPSMRVSDMTNIFPIAESLDTTGIVCRDVAQFDTITRNLYRDDGNPTARTEDFGRFPNTISVGISSKAPKILFPTDYWSLWPEDEAQKARRNFTSSLERFLGTDMREVSLTEQWKRKDPGQNGQALGDYLKHPFMTLLWKGYYDSLQGFYKDHEDKFGHPPYLHPTVRYCYQRGSCISEIEFKDALERQYVYSRWLRNDVLGGDGFQKIMVYPVGDIEPLYRDEYRKPPNESAEYDWYQREDHQASLAGVPAVVLPVGQVAHPSKVTGKPQLLPVTISLMSGVGTDQALVALVRQFADATNFPGSINVGGLAFPIELTPEHIWGSAIERKSH